MQQMIATAAVAGQGVALLTPDFFKRELASGLLTQLLPIKLCDVESYYLVYSASRRDSPKIAAFREWLTSEIAADAAPQAA
jgi:LysR family glycine cleavage system transcriptional activator